MATIGDLLNVLEHQAYKLHGKHPDDTVKGHEAAWMAVASSTLRALSHLPLGGRHGHVDAGPIAVLKPLADGPYKPPAGVIPAQRLIQIGQTMGAIADVLASTTRLDPRPGLVGSEAIKLQATLLASVHLVAGWSRSVLADQIPPNGRSAIRAELTDLTIATEPYALIPPSQRASLLEDLRIRTRAAPGLEGAVTAWADEAKPVLTERFRVSGWAMQAIAGSLALLGHVARTTIVQADARGALPPASAEEANATLGESIRAWKAAATWPPTVRLGGHAGELREAVRDLRDACTTEPLPTLAGVRHVLGIATDIGTLHAQVMQRLVTRHELWVDAESLGAAAGHAKGWIREPWWSAQGEGLLASAIAGLSSLTESRAIVAQLRMPSPALAPAGWPPEVALTPGVPPQEPKPGSRAISPGAHIGR